jgi:hypothetical protein
VQGLRSALTENQIEEQPDRYARGDNLAKQRVMVGVSDEKETLVQESWRLEQC